jgi:hypothetical protein
MAMMCTKCYQTDKRKYKAYLSCKTKGCDGELVNIDEALLPAISLLNTKGYITEFCCSGHFWDEVWQDSYILFRSDITLPNLPKGFHYDLPLSISCIRKTFDCDNIFDLQKEVLSSALDVLEWAKSLPNIK